MCGDGCAGGWPSVRRGTAGASWSYAIHRVITVPLHAPNDQFSRRAGPVRHSAGLGAAQRSLIDRLDVVQPVGIGCLQAMHALGFKQLANVIRGKLLADPPVQQVESGWGDQPVVSIAEEGPPPAPLLLGPFLVEQRV